MSSRHQDVRPLHFDPITGVKQTFVYNHDDDTFSIVTEQDVEPILQRNADLRKEFDARSDWKGEVHRVANIPAVTIVDLRTRGIWGDEAAMKKWLNSDEAKPYRTRPGRV